MKKAVALFMFLVLFIPTAAYAEPVGGAAPALRQTPSNQPYLVVSAFKVDPEPVEPGVSFTLTVDILNTSKKNIDNLLVSIGGISTGDSQARSGGGSPAFATRTTGNSHFIGRLRAGATDQVVFDLAAAPKANPGLYMARIDLNYTSGGIGYSSNQSIGISVSRTADFEFQAISVPKKVRVGKKFPISFEAVNAGGFTVEGVALSLKSDALTVNDGTVVIGALEPGDSDILEAKAKADTPGLIKADLIIKYRDDFNREKTATRTVEISVRPKAKTNIKSKAKAQGGILQSIVRFFKALFGIG